jgi:hypothetical protein
MRDGQPVRNLSTFPFLTTSPKRRIRMTADNTKPVDPSHDPLKSVAAAMATAAEAVRDGASDAAAKVQHALPATSQFVSRFVYSSCYFVSYGVVFPTMFVASYVPGGAPIASGLLDGANAANDVIADLKEKAAARKAEKQDAQSHSAENSTIVQEGVEALATA